MIVILLKDLIILLLTMNIYLLRKIQFSKLDIVTDKKYIKSQYEKNFYKEMLDLYIQNKEKFYAKGREFITNRKGKPYSESNSITFKEKLNYLLIKESPEKKTKNFNC